MDCSVTQRDSGSGRMAKVIQTLIEWPSSADTSKLSGSFILSESVAGRRRDEPSRGILEEPRRSGSSGHEAAAALHGDALLAGKVPDMGGTVNAQPEDATAERSATASTIPFDLLILIRTARGGKQIKRVLFVCMIPTKRKNLGSQFCSCGPVCNNSVGTVGGLQWARKRSIMPRDCGTEP
jgi:hypothetical protein